MRQAALALAKEERNARMLWAADGAGRESCEERLTDSLDRIRRLKAEADHLRSAIPETAKKEYFWDIPFAPETDIREAADSLLLPEGTYSEQEDFSEFSELVLFERTCEYRTGDMLSLYLSDDLDRYIVLYLDRKTIKSRLTENIKAREILCCEDETPLPRDRRGYGRMLARKYEDMISAEQISEYEGLKRDLEFLVSELPGDMARLNQKWDNMERITNLSWWTNEERLRLGQMTGDDYFRQSLWREMDISSRESDARQKIADIEYRMERILDQQQQARNAYYGVAAREAVQSSMEPQTLKALRCGKVLYSRNDIVGIIVYKGKQDLYAIRHKGNLTPYNIHGPFLSISKAGKGTPALRPLIHFLARRYVPRLRPCSPLSVRPKGASDDVWRYWSAIRLEYELSKTIS